MKQRKPRVKVNTYMEFSNTRQVRTSCKWGCVTLRWHTMVSEIRGTAALVLNSFGVFSHYAGTQKGGGSESAIIHHGFRWGVWTPLGWHKCIVLCVCHPTVKFYIKNWGYNRHKLENSGYEWNYKLSKWKWLRFEKLHMFQWKVSPSK